MGTGSKKKNTSKKKKDSSIEKKGDIKAIIYVAVGILLCFSTYTDLAGILSIFTLKSDVSFYRSSCLYHSDIFNIFWYRYNKIKGNY